MSLALLTAICLAAPTELLTTDELKNFDEVISSIVAAGFPNAAKSEVRSGVLNVRVTFDPDKERPPLPIEASVTQATEPGSTRMTYGYRFQGVHFKLADGSWVISLAYWFKPKAGDVVDAQGAHTVDLNALTQTAAKARPFSAERDGASWLEGLAPSHRERAGKAMEILVPVTFDLRLKQDALAPAIVLLHRSGWPDAAACSLSLADQRARDYWQLRPWSEPDPPFDPTGVYAQSQQAELQWQTDHPLPEPEMPATALRRALFRWCRAQITAEGAFVTPDVAAAMCKAMVEPNDPQQNAARIDALLAGMKLPITPPVNADLVGRLQSWEARTRQPRMSVNSGSKSGLSITTSFTAPKAAYIPKKEDLDKLVAMLGDERPSRFWDFSGPRTVGDNAWRALATLLESDPRSLAKYPSNNPWTPAERRLAAAAVQNWWESHRQEYVDK